MENIKLTVLRGAVVTHTGNGLFDGFELAYPLAATIIKSDNQHIFVDTCFGKMLISR